MIKVENLEFTYPGNSEATIKNISFSIAKGEIFGFLGPSGAGKSTTQKILIGILKRYSGKVSVNNTEISNVSGDFYNNIGVSFELPNLYRKLTGRENLNFFSSLYKTNKNRTDELLDMVDLSDAADKRVSNYSKGMKMRLNFCRSLVNDPEIIFFDEPTTGLDPLNAKRIKDIIKTLQDSGKTIFLTTHNMNVADELCNRVAFIVDGKLSLIDSPRQLKIDNGENLVRLEYNKLGQILHKDFNIDKMGTDKDFITLIQNEKIETIHSREASLGAPFEALFIAVLAKNKIEAMAMGKMTGVLFMAPFISWFAPAPWKFLGGIFPGFWVAESYFSVLQGGGILFPAYIAAGIFINALFFYLLLKKYNLRAD